MPDPRLRCDAVTEIVGFPNELHTAIQAEAINLPRLWSEPPQGLKNNVEKFRLAVKEAYFVAQGRRCCYCSIELSAHKLSYDAEHVLHQSGYWPFAFDFRNLAVSCKPCNGHKSNKPVLAAGDSPINAVPSNSQDYLIVHPHLDEWIDHFAFDVIGRVNPVDGSEKGESTYRMCGFDALNEGRLSSALELYGKSPQVARQLFFDDERSDSFRRKILAFLEGVADVSSDNGIASLVAEFRQSLDGIP